MKNHKSKREIDKFTIVIGDFNFPLSTMDRTARWKISEGRELNTTNRSNWPLYNIPPATAEYTSFSSALGTAIKRDYILSHTHKKTQQMFKKKKWNHTKCALWPKWNQIKNQQQRDFPGGSVVKNPPVNAGDTGSIPGPGRPHMPWNN